MSRFASTRPPGSIVRGRRLPQAERRHSSSRLVNMTDVERWSSLVGGALLAAWGLRRRDPLGFAAALLGGAVALRGAHGHSGIYDRLGVRKFSGARGTGNVIRGQAVRVERSITVRRPMDEVYRFWRAFENLPRFMEHLEEVRPLGGGLYRWVARGPFGAVTWDAEIIEEQVPWLISWQSIPGSQVGNAGSVRFSPAAAGGTEVRVELAYKPPAGVLGAAVARLLGREPAIQVDADLRRFKEILEALAPVIVSG